MQVFGWMESSELFTPFDSLIIAFHEWKRLDVNVTIKSHKKNTTTEYIIRPLVLLIEVGVNCQKKLRHLGHLSTDLAEIW